MNMKRSLTIIIGAMVWALSLCAQEAQVNVKQLIEGRRWAFLPESAGFGTGIRIEDLNEDYNRFAVVDDQLLININYFGGRLINNLTPHQEEELFDDAINNPWGPASLPPMFQSTCKIKSQEVTESDGTLHVQIRYEVVSANFDLMNSLYRMDIYLDTEDGSGTLTCRGFHYDETYFGSVAPVVVE